ncbi:FecR family protein [bacterium]|nr:FecR family protein [bacterium]
MKTILVIMLFAQCVFAIDGTFMVVKGKVRVENPKGSVIAKVGTKVQEGDTVITEKESRAKIAMEDRNIINVSPDTTFKITKYSNTKTDKNVQLNLIEGKIRNNVEEKYDNKNSKFEVRTATAVAGVRGTQFITSFNKATKVTEVITLRGQVSFQSIAAGDKPASDPVVVNKGEKSQAQEGSTAAPPVKLPEKEVQQIETDTAIKGKQTDSKEGAPPTQAGRPADKQPPPGTQPLVDLNKNNQIKDDAASRKFEKSKVKIITQPN